MRSDEDLAKFVQQRKEIQLLVGEYKKSEMLRQAVEEEAKGLREMLRYVHISDFHSSCISNSLDYADRSKEADLALLRDPTKSTNLPPSLVAASTTKSELDKLRDEMERLRSKNLELEEKLLDLAEDDE